jgi:hypothetical protein
MSGSDTTLVRARNELGQFVGDDPTTTEVDEAWVPTAVNDTTTGGEV